MKTHKQSLVLNVMVPILAIQFMVPAQLVWAQSKDPITTVKLNSQGPTPDQRVQEEQALARRRAAAAADAHKTQLINKAHNDANFVKQNGPAPTLLNPFLSAPASKAQHLSDLEDQRAWNRFMDRVDKGTINLQQTHFPIKVGNSVVTQESYNLLDTIAHPEQKGFKRWSSSYLTLMMGMGVSDAFFALTSLDIQQAKEWVRQMGSAEFHLSMMAFELGMAVTNGGLSTAAKAYLMESGAYNDPVMLPLREDIPLPSAEQLARGQFPEGYKGYGYDEKVLKALHPDPESKNLLAKYLGWQFFVLPMGDIVSSYFSSIYNHPLMQAYFKTYDPHQGGVIDPDDKSPNPQPTNDPLIQAKVRERMKAHVLSDIISQNNTADKWAALGYHGLQLGIVQVAFGEGQKFLAPLETTTENGVTQFRYKLRPMAGAVAEEAAEYKVLYTIDSVNVARFFRGLKAMRTGLGTATRAALTPVVRAAEFVGLGEYVEGVFGGVGGMAGFFVFNALVSSVQLWETTSALRKVEKVALPQALESLRWYTDPNRKELLPWAIISPKTQQWYFLQFFASGADMNSDLFKKNETPVDKKVYRAMGGHQGWHAAGNYTYTGFWEEAFKFMKDFSAEYLDSDISRQIDDGSFEMCRQGSAFHTGDFVEKHDNIWPLSHLKNVASFADVVMTGMNKEGLSAGAECEQTWYTQHKDLFAKAVKEFKPENFVKSRLTKLHTAMSDYRNGTLLDAASKTSGEWNKDINDLSEEQDRSEHYFLWFSRGADEKDPLFVANQNFWHIHVNARAKFEKEKAKYLDSFDKVVMKQKYCVVTDSNSIEQCQKNTLWDHDSIMKSFYQGNNFALNHDSFIPLLREDYLYRHGMNAEQIARLNEQEKVRKEIIKNNLAQDKDAGAKELLIANAARNSKSNLEIAEKQDKHRVQWLISGMKNEDVVKNEDKWVPEGAEKDLEGLKNQLVFYYLVNPKLLVNPIEMSGQAQGDEYNACVAMTAGQRIEGSEKTSPADCARLVTLTNDSRHILEDQPQLASKEGLKYIALVALTAKRIAESRSEFVLQMAYRNHYYKHLIYGELRANPVVRGVSQFVPFEALSALHLYDFKASVDTYHRGGDDIWSFSKIWKGLSNLPAGTINSYNFELGLYLTSLDQMLSQADLSSREMEAEGNMIDLSPLTTLTQLSEMANLSQFTNWNSAELKNSQLFHDSILTGTQLSFLSLLHHPDVRKDANGAISAAILSQFMQIAKPLWPDLRNSLNTNVQNPKEVLEAYMRFKTYMRAQVRVQAQKVVREISARGTSQVNDNDEAKLRDLLGPENFSIPLLSVTAGSASLHLKLAQILGADIINVENEKTTHARIGCFFLDDAICKQ